MTHILAENLRVLMEQKDLSMAALSRLAGTNATQVYDILHQRTRSPKLETIEKLANALNVSVLDLLSRGDRRRAEQELVAAFALLSQTDQERLLTVARAWLDAQDKSTSPN